MLFLYLFQFFQSLFFDILLVFISELFFNFLIELRYFRNLFGLLNHSFLRNFSVLNSILYSFLNFLYFPFLLKYLVHLIIFNFLLSFLNFSLQLILFSFEFVLLSSFSLLLFFIKLLNKVFLFLSIICYRFIILFNFVSFIRILIVSILQHYRSRFLI